MKYYILIFISLILTAGCRRASLSHHDFVKWVRDDSNGLRVSEKYEHFAFRLQYEPVQYKVLKDLSMNITNDSVFDKKANDAENFQYFVFSISALNNEPVLESNAVDEQEYLNRQFYLTSLISDDIVLIDGGDTLHPLVSHYERNYGQSLSDNVNLIFPVSKDPGDKILIFYDPLFEKRTIELKIEHSDIEDIPELKKISA